MASPTAALSKLSAFGRRTEEHPIGLRRRRVARLRSDHPHAAEMLAFYDDVLVLQEPLHARARKSRWLRTVEAADGRAPRLRLERLPERSRAREFLRFVRSVPASATELLREVAARLAAAPGAASDLLRAALASEPVDAVAVRLECDAAALAFFPRAFVQPLAEALAEAVSQQDAVGHGAGAGYRGAAGRGAAADVPEDGGQARGQVRGAAADGGAATGRGAAAGGRDGSTSGDASRAVCPTCGAPPVAAVLRDEPQIKGRRTLLCSLCLTEWTFPRTRCPACGEERAEKRPHHVSESWPHVRVEECGSCRSYIKAVDLRENGLAVPVVDELASVELDLWAVEQGLSKLRTNLLGM